MNRLTRFAPLALLIASTGAWAEIETSAFTAANIAELLEFLQPGAGNGLAELPPASLARPRSERSIDRFDNPEAVRQALAAIGREDWADS